VIFLILPITVLFALYPGLLTAAIHRFASVYFTFTGDKICQVKGQDLPVTAAGSDVTQGRSPYPKKRSPGMRR
jgi:hypothetical protein